MKFKRTDFILTQYGLNVVERAQRNLSLKGFAGQKSNRSKNSSGKLSAGLGFTVKENPKGLVTSFTSKEDYGKFVEEGRKAGKGVPIAPLMEWLDKKPIKLRKTYINKNGQKFSEFVKRTEANKLSAAIAISKSIKQRGIKEVPFMSTAMQKEFDALPNELAEAIVEDIQNAIIDDFKKDENIEAKK